MIVRYQIQLTTWFLSTLISVLLCFQASAQSPSPESAGEGIGPINSLCPVTTDEPIDDRFTVIYKDQKIGLCCRRCKTKFEADPERYVANLPEIVLVSSSPAFAAQEHAPIEYQEHADNVDHDHQDSTDEHDSATQEHDHAADHGGSSSKIIPWLGKFHPPATHLPIGLLIAAAIAETGFMLTKRDVFRHSVLFCVTLGAIGALGTVTLGWFNGGFVLLDEDWVQATHRWLGTGTALGATLAALVLAKVSMTPEPTPSRTGFRVVLFLTAGLISATGFFGGALVYGLNHYAW